jgi:hypothetical protein
MSQHDHSHSHDRGHSHGQSHDHSHHHHAHGSALPHPPMALPPSFLRMSIGTRLGIAALASAGLWGVVWLAMRPN